jgi:hypothetical protein
MAGEDHEVLVEERGRQAFVLAVVFDGRRFDCGVYVSRAEALKAARLFVQRKQGEQASRGKRQRR